MKLFFTLSLLCWFSLVSLRIVDTKSPSLLTKFNNFFQQISVEPLVFILIFVPIVNAIVYWISNNIDYPFRYFLQFISIIIWILARLFFNHTIYQLWKISFRKHVHINLTDDSILYIYRFLQSNKTKNGIKKVDNYSNNIILCNEADKIIGHIPHPYTENELSGWIIICLMIAALHSNLPELTESCIALILGKIFWIEIPHLKNIYDMFTKRILFLGIITFIISLLLN